MTDCFALLRRYYPPDSPAYPILLDHSLKVSQMAMRIAERLQKTGIAIDVAFVQEAALLHDIGIGETRAAGIGCYGNQPYICHGLKGRELLEAEGLPRHALVCERHIGVGIGIREIREQKLPLPERDMRPLSLEEQVVTYADLFFSKDPRQKTGNPVQEIRAKLLRYGAGNAAVFDNWRERFGV